MICDDPQPNQAPGRGNNCFVVETQKIRRARHDLERL